MEGAPQAKAEKGIEAGGFTPEQLESIERAKALDAEIKEIVPEYGKVVNLAEYRRLKEVSAELNKVLEEVATFLPAEKHQLNKLPYHPHDYEYSMHSEPMPEKPNYPLAYEPKRGAGHKVGQQQRVAANDNRQPLRRAS